MPLIITILVTLIVIIYVRSNKRAKQQWLTTLDLPGRWVMQTAEGYLQLQGGLSEGTFTTVSYTHLTLPTSDLV